ncbi:hypothetical protein [Flavobacterium sp. FlaQc-50]|uniref:hypothetical protein n=1 Tax=unclassified Flavobacterium TaxID=196869 RepID=UPI00375645EB
MKQTKLVSSIDTFNSISIEWTGNVDKPIPKIIICTNCTDKKEFLLIQQYSVNAQILDEIRDILLNKDRESNEEIKINEKNKKIYIQKLNEIVLLLVKKKQNQLFINNLEIFIRRIDY